MSRFTIKFWVDLADQPGSVVVQEECQETEVPGPILGGYTGIQTNESCIMIHVMMQ